VPSVDLPVPPIRELLDHFVAVRIQHPSENTNPLGLIAQISAIERETYDRRQDLLHFFFDRQKALWGRPLIRTALLADMIQWTVITHGQGILRDPTTDDRAWVACQVGARAARVFRECLSLLDRGFAQGATARWRTLFELAVVGHLISDSSSPVDLARDYVAHADARHAFELNRLLQQATEFGFEVSVNRTQVNEMLAKADTVSQERHYPPWFAQTDWGWAYTLLPDITRGNFGFSNLARRTPFAELMYLYWVSSGETHGTTAGAILNREWRGDGYSLILNEESYLRLEEAGNALCGLAPYILHSVLSVGVHGQQMPGGGVLMAAMAQLAEEGREMWAQAASNPDLLVVAQEIIRLDSETSD